ncbi:MAG TPA: hypothetical protein VFW06_02765 [Acidimicrobiia bacterium]|nr:hypothetical protein [Acidimicrobiia bacterium]
MAVRRDQDLSSRVESGYLLHPRVFSSPTADSGFDRPGEAAPELGSPTRLGDLMDAAEGHGLKVVPEVAVLNGGPAEPLHELRAVLTIGERAVVTAGRSDPGTRGAGLQPARSEAHDLAWGVKAGGPLENLLHRPSEAEDVPNVILCLCLPESRQITGQFLHTSAGNVV